MNDQRGSESADALDDDVSCEVCSTENPHFAAGDRWMLAGALTVDTAASVVESSREAALPGTGIVDLSGVEVVDSAAVAVLLAWRRRAAGEGVELTFTGAPASLAALAELYDVEDLISRKIPTPA
jgi:phospholipid transport system transporter-binding protein